MQDKLRIRQSLQRIVSYNLGGTFPAFLDNLNAVVKDIPQDELKFVTIEWCNGDDFDSGYLEFEYQRPETDNEANARLARSERARLATIKSRKEAKIRKEENDRKVYETLKAKFDPSP